MTCRICNYTGPKDDFSHHSGDCWRCCQHPVALIPNSRCPLLPGEAKWAKHNPDLTAPFEVVRSKGRRGRE